MTYAGELTSREAYERLVDEPGTRLVDVRTHAEWTYVGTPDLSALGKQVVTISWSFHPDAVRNPRFVDDLVDSGVTTDHEVLFLCRSGARSRAAAVAATAAGYTAYNISDGFEGPLDEAGRRNTVTGWRAAGLPWRQS